jgi:glutathione synthase/RimK-type ligase-like ATP-grasp enzyme
LRCTPGIFQKKIDKKYEIRVTYFDDHYIAVKIDSQKNEKTKMDWRAAPTNELLLEQILLPKNLDSCCRKLMQVLGIVFACFDFIVTPQDEYYFLEVNEQGQFLWIEDVNPNIKMLKAFSEFIATQHHLRAKMPGISLADFEQEAANLQKQAMQCHVNPPHYN